MSSPALQPPVPPTGSSSGSGVSRGLLLALGGLLVVGFWSVWAQLTRTWLTNPQYSHGVLVIPFAAFLLWHRRTLAPAGPLVPTWWAVPVLLGAAVMRVVGARYYIETLEQYALFPTILGLVLAVGGWAALRWSWPSIAFLFFMVPLHGRVSGLLTGPLQTLATRVSTYLLQTVGIPATCSGNVIHLTEVDVGVVEACNGLRMMMTFFALTTAVAVVVARPGWQKVLIALSAVPISIACNVLRIAGTGVLHETVGPELADRVFHDLAGWLMMPSALGVLWLGLRVLDRIVVPVPPPRPTAAPPSRPVEVPSAYAPVVAPVGQ